MRPGNPGNPGTTHTVFSLAMAARQIRSGFLAAGHGVYGIRWGDRPLINDGGMVEKIGRVEFWTNSTLQLENICFDQLLTYQLLSHIR